MKISKSNIGSATLFSIYTNKINDIIAGRVSIDSVPSSGNPKHPNIESFVEYIKKIKNG